MDINQPINPAYPTYPQQPRIMPYEPQTKSKSPIIFIIIGIILIALIGLGIFLLTKSSSGKISDGDLAAGTSVGLKENSQIKFDIGEEEHKITVISILDVSAKITVQSTPINVTFTLGQTKKFNLSSDSFYDLSVKLNNITDGEADFYIKKINETMCEEDWSCTEWGECAEEKQNRTCTDANNCGTFEQKPAEIQDCDEITLPACSELQGFLCATGQTCNGTINDSLQGDCCVGNCITATLEVTVCSNMDCMITASNTCHPANITYSNFGTSNFTWVQNYTYYYKIRGFEGELCEFYQEILTVSGIYTVAGVSALTSQGKAEQIDAMELEMNNALQDMEGDTGICRFSVYGLNEYLTQIRDENYVLTEEDIVNHGCTGSLYGS